MLKGKDVKIEVKAVKQFLSLLVLLSIVLAGCSGTGYKNVTSKEAKDLIDKGKVTVIDVRTPEEYNSGHIPGAKLIPLQVIDGSTDSLKKDGSYLIVCHSGNRSQQASEILTEKGFKNIYNMTGGMNDWKYSIEK